MRLKKTYNIFILNAIGPPKGKFVKSTSSQNILSDSINTSSIQVSDQTTSCQKYSWTLWQQRVGLIKQISFVTQSPIKINNNSHCVINTWLHLDRTKAKEPKGIKGKNQMSQRQRTPLAREYYNPNILKNSQKSSLLSRIPSKKHLT